MKRKISMTEIVIVAAARTPIGAFMGGLGSLPADQLGATVIKALGRAKVEPAEVSDVILGQVLTAGQGQNPARQAAIKAGLPKRDASDHDQPGLRLGPAGGRFGQSSDQGRRCVGRPGRRAGEHEPVDPLRLSARRHQDGQPRVRRHHDQGRALGRVQRLPHGHHGRERGAAVADHARSAGPVRGRVAEEGAEAQRPGGSRTRSSRSRSRPGRATLWSTRTST